MNEGNNVLLFMAASGILVAVLLVWAQLWANTAIQIENNKGSTINSGFGLSYCFYAIVSSMLSFGITIFMGSVTQFSLVLLSYSYLISTGLVVISLISSVVKVCRKVSMFSTSLECLSNTSPRVIITFLPLALFPIYWILIVNIPVTSAIFGRLVG